MFFGLHEDVQLLDSAILIEGTVKSNSDYQGPILVALFNNEQNKKPTPSAYSVVYGDSKFQFLSGTGEYYLIAFEDKNEDLSLQEDEHVGWYGTPTLIKALPGADYSELIIELRPPEEAKLMLPQLYESKDSRVLPEIQSQQLGKLVSLNDPRFSSKVGSMGLWNPVEFVQQGNNGIFFVEPYDPSKIPVLFVHGINASGGDWRYIIEHLDRKKYQPWIVQYPSGMRLELLSHEINQAFTQVQLRYNFQTAYVVAHSMGGLVSRGFINKNLAQNQKKSPIKLFVSISTPWGGHAAAGSGVNYAPVVVPSWYDMVPGSRYINALFEMPLPEFIPHYVLFSHGGSYSLLSDGNTDGVVSLRSQLPIHIQEQAEMVIGYDEGHVSILNSDAVVRKLDEILNDAF